MTPGVRPPSPRSGRKAGANESTKVTLSTALPPARSSPRISGNRYSRAAAQSTVSQKLRLPLADAVARLDDDGPVTGRMGRDEA